MSSLKKTPPKFEVFHRSRILVVILLTTEWRLKLTRRDANLSFGKQRKSRYKPILNDLTTVELIHSFLEKVQNEIAWTLDSLLRFDKSKMKGKSMQKLLETIIWCANLISVSFWKRNRGFHPWWEIKVFVIDVENNYFREFLNSPWGEWK